jgi:hypothetical protein
VHATSAHLDTKAVRTKTASLETVNVTLTPKSGGTAITWFDNFNIADQPANGLWGGKVSGAPNDWKWTDVSINVISFFNGISDKILSVKSTSQAYRYYKGAPNIWTTAPTVPTIGDPNIFIVDDTNTLPIKWKIYAANRFTAEENPTWGIILSDKASLKEIVIEIREHDTIPTGEPHSTGNSTSNSEDLAADAGTPIKKLVIDYSAVT